MQAEDIELLKCVDCDGGLEIEDARREEQTLVDGLLRCYSCDRRYPILNSVAIFFRREVLKDYLQSWEIEHIRKLGYDRALEGASNRDPSHLKQVSVAENWQYQWQQVLPYEASDLEEDDLMGESLFWKFIPISRELVRSKKVLVACGGRGRETYHLAKCNPEKIVVNELGTEIYSIADIIPDSGKRLVLLRSDISYPPIKENSVEVAICDHALQHVLDHRLAFSKLTKSVKMNGTVAICVYSRENNYLMTHIVEPAKAVVKFLPLRLQRMISFLPAAVIYLLIRYLYWPLASISNGKSAIFLPLFDHMMFWSKNSFRLVWMSCFDLIHAPIAHYFSQSEIVKMAGSYSVNVDTLSHTHGTTWSLVAHKVESRGTSTCRDSRPLIVS